jgi:hypothetical protein
MRVEVYSCNSPVSVNQVWFFNKTNVISSGGSQGQQCMTACTAIQPGTVGNVAKVVSHNATSVVLETTTGALWAAVFYAPDVVRLRLANFGERGFDDPAGSDIVASTDFDRSKELNLTVEENAATIVATTADVVLTVQRAPLLVTLTRADTGQVLLQETAPLQWNTSSTWQTVARGTKEYAFGGGMQNGFFAQRDRSVPIMEGGGWDAGGRANPAPFYTTTAGLGVLRNTYATGRYDFFAPSTLRHEEARFDAWVFVGPALPRVLDLYTQATGRPFLPPIWGLNLGDSDCYNQRNRTTTDVISVAQGYTENDIPGGWMIPNDGYGCGYTKLPYVIDQLHLLGKYTALWTSTGLANATWEIGTAGSRGIKTDVGWVGAGYKFELDAVKLAASLIEDNSNARRYTWTVCGWAGTHAYAVMWTVRNA